MSPETSTIPTHIIRTFNEIYDNSDGPYRNDWDAEKLLKIFQEALSLRTHFCVQPARFWEQFSLIQTTPATKQRIQSCAIKLWFSALYPAQEHASLDVYLDNKQTDEGFEECLPWIYQNGLYLLESADTQIEKEQRRAAILRLPYEIQFKFFMVASGIITKDYPSCILTAIIRETQEIRQSWQIPIFLDGCQLIEKIEASSTHVGIFAALNKIGFPTYREVITAAKPLLKNITDGEEIANVLMSLSKVKAERRSEIVDVLLTSKLQKVELSFHLIIEKINRINPKEIDEIIELASTLVGSPGDGTEWANILTQLLIYPKEECKELCVLMVSKCAVPQPLMTDAYCNILEQLKKFNVTERSDLLDILEEFTSAPKIWENICLILNAFHLIPADERKIVAQLIKMTLKECDSVQIPELIHTLSCLTHPERTQLIEDCRPLFITTTDVRTLQVITAVARIKAEERTQFCQDVLEVTKNDELMIAIVAPLLTSIPERERKNIAQHAVTFIRDGVDNPLMLVKYLFRMDETERDHIIKISKPLTETVKDAFHICKIFDQVAATPTSQQIPTIQACIPFLHQKKRKDNRHGLVEALALIPPTARPTVCSQTLSLITDPMGTKTCVAILAIVFSTLEEERDQLVEHLLNVKEIVQPGQEELYEAVRSINSADRAEIVQIIKELKTGKFQEAEITLLVNNLAQLNKEEWKHSLKKMGMVCEEIFCKSDIEYILNTMPAFTENQLKILIKHAKPYTQTTNSGKDIARILCLCNSLTEPDMQERITMLSVLFNNQQGIDLIETFLEYRAYPSEELAQMVKDLGPILVRMSNGANKRQIIRSYFGLLADRRSIMTKQFEFFLQFDEETDLQKHFDELLKIPYKEWSFFPHCRDVLRMMGNESSQASQKILLYKTLCQFNWNERLEIVSYLKQLSDFSKQFVSIAEALFNIPHSRREKVILLAKPRLEIYNEESVDDYFQKIYKKLVKVEKPKDPFLIRFPALANENLAGLGKELIKVPEQEWRWILDCILTILSNGANQEDFSIVLIIAKLGKQRTDELLNTGRELFRKCNSLSNQKDLLVALNAIPNEQFEEIIDDAKRLMQYSFDTNIGSLVSAINALLLIEKSQRRVIFQEADSLFRGFSVQECIKIMEELKEIPAEEIRDLLADCLPLFRLISVDKKEIQIKLIIHVLNSLPKQERKLFVSFARQHLRLDWGNELNERLVQLIKVPSAILQRISSECKDWTIPRTLNLFAILTAASFLDAKDAIDRTKHLFFLYNDNHYSRFLSQFLNVPLERRDKLLRIVMSNHKAFRYPLQLALYLKLLIQVEESDLDQFIVFSSRIMQKFGVKRSSISSTFLEVRPQDRETVLTHLEKIPLPWFLKASRMDLIGSINELLKNNRLNLLEALYPFLACAESHTAAAKLIEEINKVDDEDCLEILPLLLKYKYKTSFAASVFTALSIIDKSKRKLLLQKSAFLFNKPLMENNLGQIAEELNRIPLDKVDDILGDLETLIANFTRSPEHYYDINRLILILRSITGSARKAILHHARHYLQQYQSTLYLAKVIEAFSECSRSELEEVIQALDEFNLPLFYYNRLPALIRTIIRFSSEERRKGIKQCLSHLIEVHDNPLHIISYASGISLIAKEERAETMKMCRPLLEYHLETINTFQIFSFIPFALRQKAVEICLNASDKSTESYVIESLFKDRDIREKSLEYMFTHLENHVEDKQLIHEMVNFILDKYEQIGIPEEHPLFQKSVELKAVLCSSHGDLKNPYVLFQNLKQNALNPCIPFDTPKQIFLDHTVAINLETLRAKAQDRVFTQVDLPKGIPADGFHQLFRALQQRVHSLPLDLQLRINKYISETYLHSAQRLKELFLEKPLILNLLKAKDSLCHVVDSAAYYLYVLLKFIFDKSDQVKEGQFLTDREDILLKISCSINECSTGQRDGIINYYNQLPLEYRISQSSPEMGSEGKISEVIDAAFQIVMNDVFSDPHILFELEPSASGHFGPHRSLFLKNRLFKQVGFRHRLLFDLHSQIIHDALLNISLMKLMEVFFRYLRIDAVTRQLRRSIPEALLHGKITYMDLLRVIENGRKLRAEEYLTVFEFDDEGKLLNLTERGALWLLVGSKYVVAA